jgi:MFS family permease
MHYRHSEIVFAQAGGSVGMAIRSDESAPQAPVQGRGNHLTETVYAEAASCLDPTAQAPGVLERLAISRAAWRLIPVLVACYFVSYLDRVNLSFAALQMNKALGLSSAAYGLGAGLFFLTYCICEIPSNLLLHRFGATRWIARIMVSLGVCAGAMAFVDGKTSFYVVRLLLGAAEAGFYPGVLFLLTLWFPAAYRARMLGIFIAAIPVSGIIGAPLSGLLLSLNGYAGLAGWQWLYLVEALPAILLAPVVVWRLQDGPEKAPCMPDRERAWLIGQLGRERAEATSRRQVTGLQSLTNGRVLFLAAIYFSNVCLLNSITFFLPQIVRGFGLSTTQTGFVAALPSLLALVAMIVWARHSDRTAERYGHAALANCAGGAALLISVLVADPVMRVAALAASFACTLSFTTPFWSIPSTFLAGAGAAGGIGTISALGVIGGFVAPWFIGYVKDSTGNFHIGLGAIGILAMLFSVALYLARPPALPAGDKNVS